MEGLRRRLTAPRRLWVLLGLATLGLLVALYALSAENSAAHSARTGASATLTFTVTIKAGAPPADVIFWVCPDAQTDGTGCNEMTAQPNGSFLYQLTTTTGTTYQQVIIEWSHGRLPSNNGPIPQPPAQVSCRYTALTITASNSINCQADFSALAVTPTIPTSTNTPAPAATGTPAPGIDNSDTSTLVTGLDVVIGVGLVLFVILLGILIWQRASARRQIRARRP